MTAATKQAVENLYTVFSKYPLNPNMDASPLYPEKEVAKWNAAVSSKPLREFTGDELAFFAFKVCYTWGGTDDYKHFLPRFLELIAQYKEALIESWVVFDKLNYCHWRDWPKQEYDAILLYLESLWLQLLQEHDEKIDWVFESHFTSIAKVYPSFEWLLSKWEEANTGTSIIQFCNFIDDNFYELTRRKRIPEFDETPQLLTEFLQWAKVKMRPKLLAAFETSNDETLLQKLVSTQETLDNI
ncbi:hypothetical protein [Botryobacter ruber]|uniref:hypothetical protein n=1 Tax=Botryobacter ruber TaxID=2171629 RepID=UPI000E0C96BA|nr:hypothetical protein [Botryobacter ruber]